MEFLVVIIAILSFFLVFGVSAVVFVPMLETLEPGQLAGGLSNLWLIGTLVVAIVVFRLVIWGLDKWLNSPAEKGKERITKMKEIKKSVATCVFLLFVVSVVGADDAVRRYGWPLDGEVCTDPNNREVAGLAQSQMFQDGICIWATNSNLTVARYYFEAPQCAQGVKVSLKYNAEQDALVKLYIGPKSEDCNNSGSTFTIPVDRNQYEFVVEDAAKIVDSSGTKVDISVANGVVDIHYIELEWLRYKPRVEIIHREGVPEPFYRHHYYYKVPIYVYETPYRVVIYDHWWETRYYYNWYDSVVVVARPVVWVYQPVATYYPSYDWRWDCRPVRRDHPDFDRRPPRRDRSIVGDGVRHRSSSSEELEVKTVDKNVRAPFALTKKSSSMRLPDIKPDLSSGIKPAPGIARNSEIRKTKSEFRDASARLAPSGSSVQPVADVKVVNPTDLKARKSILDRLRGTSTGQTSGTERQVIRSTPREQQSQIQWGVPEKKSRLDTVKRVFNNAVNTVFDTGTRSGSGANSAPAATNDSSGESVFQKRRPSENRQPSQQVQQAPARTETRREGSSTSNSSSNSDDEHKKKRRDR